MKKLTSSRQVLHLIIIAVVLAFGFGRANAVVVSAEIFTQGPSQINEGEYLRFYANFNGHFETLEYARFTFHFVDDLMARDEVLLLRNFDNTGLGVWRIEHYFDTPRSTRGLHTTSPTFLSNYLADGQISFDIAMRTGSVNVDFVTLVASGDFQPIPLHGSLLYFLSGIVLLVQSKSKLRNRYKNIRFKLKSGVLGA